MNDYLEELSNRVPDVLWNISLIFFSVLVAFLVKITLVPLIRRASLKSNQYSLFRSALQHFRVVFMVFIPLIIFNGLLPLLKFNTTTFAIVSKTTEIAIIICFTIVIIKIIRIAEDYLYHLYDYTKKDNLRERKIRTQITFVRKLLVTLLVIITIAVVLLSFESMRKIGAGLLTGVGIGGIIIGFAAQQSLGNLLAGFQIAFTQPIRIDDVLVVEGEWGRVEEITLTYVVLSIWDKRRLILPINYFIQTPFQNWTRNTAEILGTVFIYTDFTVPVAPLRSELSRLLRANPLWDGQVDVLQVTDFKERTMELRCLMSCRNSGEAFELRCYIRENMITYIQNNFPESLAKTRIDLSGKERGAIMDTNK